MQARSPSFPYLTEELLARVQSQSVTPYIDNNIIVARIILSMVTPIVFMLTVHCPAVSQSRVRKGAINRIVVRQRK